MSPLSAPPPSPPSSRSIHDDKHGGVLVSDPGTKGRLEDCELWGNADCAVWVQQEGDPTLLHCAVHDEVDAAGVYVDATAAGKATVGEDCVFARNAGGDIVRK